LVVGFAVPFALLVPLLCTPVLKFDPLVMPLLPVPVVPYVAVVPVVAAVPL
jgi:hypothetical protein